MSNEVALSIEGLQVHYGAVHALKGIDITVKEGSVVALLGANGAGKTTTLQTISGLVQASAGKIRFYDKDITNMEAEHIASLGIAQSPEGRQIFPDLTVGENLQIGAYTVKSKKTIDSCYDRVYNHFPLLKDRNKQLARTLSGGELQMLAIARALMSDPKILLLDEPSLGLAPMIVQGIFQIIGEIKKEGTTVVIVEQNALQTLKIADYGYVLELGKINISGEASVLIKDQRLIDAYLGNK
jgi:branched-chain amino acid transport system ATP-binding protein